LRNYENSQRPRVESAQDNSRALAKMMFRRSRLLAKIRDVAARFMTLKMALGPIRKLLETAPQA
jgi:2-polyprenyl-6-methoxyphenol hydroxylase-like FAD-dependent oxidoreductase